MAEKERFVGSQELAEWLGVTTRRIQQLAVEGVLPREGRGRYPLKICVKTYCDWKDQLLLKRGTSSELSEEKLLTARLERRTRELVFAEAEGSLITVAHHERVMGEAFSMVRQNIRNLPGALAPRLAGLDDPRDVERILVPAIDDALRSIVAAGLAMADDTLPDDLPGKKALARAGVKTITGLLALGDLNDVPGIGAKTGEGILEWMNGI